MSNIPAYTLNDGNSIPALGLGLWKIWDDEAKAAIVDAVAAGYRLLDTASFYKNEAGVGAGIKAAAINRGELFITTKVWNDNHGYDKTMRAFEESMRLMELDYLDMYLIHWPVPSYDKYVETWRALIQLQKDGRVRSIGVSNFLPVHLQRIIDETGVTPAVNQIEYHPFFKQPDVAEANARLGIKTECWAPLGRGGAMDHPVVTGLTAKYGKSPAQIILRWHLDRGFIVIPKSSNPERLRQNLDVFDFHLDAADIKAIEAIDIVKRTGADPMTFTLPE